ncbi:MAG: haloacid dehalogenase [Dehalococcoidia bacterium]
MDSPTSNLGPIVEKIRDHFNGKHAAREAGLPLCREAIRNCANSIRATHRGEFDEARRLMGEARSALDRAKSALGEHPDVFYAGFVHDAQKEYAEAAITLVLASSGLLPDPDELGVTYSAYLKGMGEAVGEMRRHLLDTLRRGDVARCEEVLASMDEIYTILITMDYPDAITAGLRRTTDMVRGVVERTRGDLTIAYRQSELESWMRRLQKSIEDRPQ